mgnify:CR=1 FL=1
MRLISRSSFGVVTGLLILTASFALAAEPIVTVLPSAQLVAVEGAARTYQLTDYDGRIITAVVPSQSVTDIQGRGPDGTVRGTFIAVGPETNQVRIVTQQGQTLVLALESRLIRALQPGDSLEFLVP